MGVCEFLQQVVLRSRGSGTPPEGNLRKRITGVSRIIVIQIGEKIRDVKALRRDAQLDR